MDMAHSGSQTHRPTVKKLAARCSAHSRLPAPPQDPRSYRRTRRTLRRLPSQRPIAGQILVTPFDSIEAIARRRYRIVPVSVLLRHPFRSIDHLRDVDIPTAVIAAGQDTVVPPVRTETLVRSLRHLAMYKVVPDTSHSGIYDLDIITDLLHDALDAVEGGASSGTGGTRSQGPEPSPVRVHR